MSKFEQKVLKLKQTIKEINCNQAKQLQEQGALIIDSRTIQEFDQGHINNSIHLGRDYLEMRIEKVATDELQPLIIVCQAGVRSLFAAESLKNLGYKNVCSLSGGINAWQEQYPLTK